MVFGGKPQWWIHLFSSEAQSSSHQRRCHPFVGTQWAWSDSQLCATSPETWYNLYTLYTVSFFWGMHTRINTYIYMEIIIDPRILLRWSNLSTCARSMISAQGEMSGGLSCSSVVAWPEPWKILEAMIVSILPWSNFWMIWGYTDFMTPIYIEIYWSY